MGAAIRKLEIKNYGAIPTFSWRDISKINLVIGENGTGKTFLLKAIYSAIRTLEEYKRGEDIRSVNDVLSEKLRWTFQVEKLGDLVNRSCEDGLSFAMELDDKSIAYQFTSKAVSKAGTADASSSGKEGNSIFIPAKEVLSLFSVILKSREIDQSFGFDDTYYDLAKALRIAPTRGKSFTAFAESRKKVTDVIDGKIEYNSDSSKWTYRNSLNQKFAIGATSEGVKKISIVDRLLANGYLDNNSVIFIDEIESALHPDAICQFLDMIAYLAKEMNLQFFVTSHSYFVIKKLVLIALQNPSLVSCLSLGKDKDPQVFDLHDGMPDNSIIDTSIRLYEEEIEVAL